MLNIFETGKTSFDTTETLKVMELRDAVLAAVLGESNVELLKD